ncbi:hypothetical protein LXL04_014440 [Taraxacum kok-saghyz]
MFAFVRFMNGDPAGIAKSLCSICIGELWLHANPARHPRQPMAIQVKLDRPFPVPPKIGKPEVVGSKSYAKVVQRDSEKKETVITEEPSSSVILTDESLVENAYPFALLGCYKDFRAVANTRNLCQGEGFRDVQPVYLGGLWVLLDFVSLEARDKFLNHAPLKYWFDILQPWFNKFVVKERILWVEVEGVPVLSWSRSTFEAIASKWGKLIFLDDSDGCNRFSMRLGIVSHSLIFESVFVTIRDVEYCVRVRELSSWTPSFLSGFSDEEAGGSKYDDDSYEADGDDSVKSC